MTLTLIGFGEAGQAIAQGLRTEPNGPEISCFDIKSLDPHQASSITQAASKHDVSVHTSLAEALQGASYVISTVTAGSAPEVAQAVADLRPTLEAYFDMNSVSPGTKRHEAKVLEHAGIAYVDTAVMAPIHPRLHRTPVLLAGPKAEALERVLGQWGMDTRVVGDEVGRASSIKMLRSVMIKGLEALTAEMGLAAERAGVTTEVIDSLNASFPSVDWGAWTSYNLERMATHGVRRAEEMEEVVKTLEDLGIEPDLTEGTVRRQRRFGESDVVLDSGSPDLQERSRIILSTMKII